MNTSRKILRRAGFTLIELLLVILILGILGTVVVMNFGDVGGDARKTATMESIRAVSQACEVYRMKTGRGYPKDLEVLTRGINDDEPLLKAGSLKDGWGVALEYKLDGKKYSIISAGADGQMNTPDDITD
ncbi:MAG: type II secretion system protein GspG [Kiritimatiellia bacterium]